MIFGNKEPWDKNSNQYIFHYRPVWEAHREFQRVWIEISKKWLELDLFFQRIYLLAFLSQIPTEPRIGFGRDHSVFCWLDTFFRIFEKWEFFKNASIFQFWCPSQENSEYIKSFFAHSNAIYIYFIENITSKQKHVQNFNWFLLNYMYL